MITELQQSWTEERMLIQKADPEVVRAAHLCVEGTVRQLTDEEIACIVKHNGARLRMVQAQAVEIGDFQARWALDHRKKPRTSPA